MKKVLVVMIALAMVLTVSVTAFAETGGKTDIQKPERARVDRGKQMARLFETFYPEGVDDLEAVHQEHQEFHEGARAGKMELKESVKAEMEAIKAAVENGEIDRRSGRIQMIKLRMSIRNMRNGFDETTIDKINAQGDVHDRLSIIRDELKLLLKADPVDKDAVGGLLAESLKLFKTHLDNDRVFHQRYVDTATEYGY